MGRVGVLIAAAALISGCGLFELSPFPDYLTLARTSASLSGLTLPGNQVYRQLFVESSGTQEFVYLVESDGAGGNSNNLIILDTNLNVLFNGSDPNFGTTHFVDASGDFVIGADRFDPTVSPIVPAAIPLPSGYTAGPSQPTVFDGTNYFWVSASSSAGSNPVLQANAQVSSDWSTVTSPGLNFDLTTDTSGASYTIHSVQDDPAAGNTAITFDTPTGRKMIVFPSAKFTTLSTPLFDNYGVKLPAVSSQGELFYTRRGEVIVDNGSLEAIRGNGTTATYQLPHGGNYTYGFSVDGNYFYVFNPTNDEMVRCRTWW